MNAPSRPVDGAPSYLESLFGLNGVTAMVTGASRGLGAAMAFALAGAGARVALVGRRDNLAGTADAIRVAGGHCLEIVGDLASRRGIDDIVTRCERELGPVDVLVNNAGTFVRKPALEWTTEAWDEVVDPSTKTVLWACQRVAPSMLERGSGKIINVTSVLAFQGGYTVPGYAASRHALLGLTRALANEWASRGVNVNAIAPGYVDTDLLEGLKNDAVRSRQLLERVPAGRWGRPSELAGAVVYLASDAARFVHGSTLVVDGGWLSR